MKNMIREYIQNELGIDDPGITDELIADYIALLAHLLSDMRKTFNKRDFPALRTLAHTLKGSSANVGAEPFRALALVLQESADAQNERRCGALITGLEMLQSQIEG